MFYSNFALVYDSDSSICFPFLTGAYQSSAEKSGHDQFEESIEEVCISPFPCPHLLTSYHITNPLQIKPLTEEEKRQKLAELRQKMAEKRAQSNVKEVEDAKSNEALRRKAGKVRKMSLFY